MSELFANLDQEMLILIGGGIGAVVLILVLAVATILLMRPRARLRNRMAGLGLARGGTQAGRAAGGGARQRRVQERLKELEDKGKKRTRGHEMRVQIMQAGLDVHPRSFILVSIAVGLMSAVIYLLAFSSSPQVIAIAVAVVAGIMLPRKVLRFLAGRRQKKFTQNFANAIDVLVRGIRSGLPVGECLAIIGRESPEPIGEEFRLMVEGQRLGMTMEELFRRGLERIPTPEYKFFSIVLQIQQQTGGNLAETLENLSRVLRERKKLRDKVKALSAEAKASAMIIGALPLFVMLAVRVMTPDYLDPLFEEEQGQKMLAGAVIWMLLGVGMMAKMINFQI